MKWFYRGMLVLLLLDLLSQPGLAQPRPAQLAAPAVSFWGVNGYLTKRERTDAVGTVDNLDLLTSLAVQSGARWSLEELSWALIEPQAGNRQGIYDVALRRSADAGLNTIGMLITTPAWARDSGAGCAAGDYFCAPADPNAFAAFAGWMAERYDGDGVNDAPGSPRVGAWQIWNEPNFKEQFFHSNEAVRRQRYGQLLVAAYAAIKAADPSAIVVLGGVYVFDGTPQSRDGYWFLNPLDGVFGLVPQAKQSFDAFGFHPYMPTVAPDKPGEYANALLEGRIRTTREWVNRDAGRADAALWITEIGWCTAPGSGACPAVLPEQQANYLIRSLVLAQQNGIGHASWLQLEDAFDGNHPWAGSALLENLQGQSYPPKLAYDAYTTLAATLTSATPLGPGPAHTHVYVANTQLDNGTYDYRYARSSTIIDVLWVPSGTRVVNFTVDGAKEITVLTRRGQSFTPPRSGNVLTLSLSEDPIFVVQRAAPQLIATPATLPLLAKNGAAAQNSFTLSNAAEGAIAWSASDNAAWLTLSATSGTTPVTVVATAAPGTPDNAQATITITGASQTRTIQVTLRAVSNPRTIWVPLLRK